MAVGPEEIRMSAPYQIAELLLFWQYHGVFQRRLALIIITSIALVFCVNNVALLTVYSAR